MIKAMHVAICDACGKYAAAQEVGNQRDSNWMPPSDWQRGAYNSDVHFCPECYTKLTTSNSKIAFRDTIK